MIQSAIPNPDPKPAALRVLGAAPFEHSCLKLMGHEQAFTGLDDKLLRRCIHLDQVCWSRKASKICRAAGPDDQAWEKRF